MRFFGKNINLLLKNLMVSYTDDGPDDAPVIIFIHGFPLNKSMWNKQLTAFKQEYRVIAYDVRGHGASQSGNRTFSMENFADDLVYFMNVLKIDKASLCGLSMGGYIALNALEKYPERFESIVLCDCSSFVDANEMIEKRIKAIKHLEKYGQLRYVDRSTKILFGSNSLINKVKEIADVKEMILATSVESHRKTLLALNVRNEKCTMLPKIRIPVLVLVGEEDQISPPAIAEYMQKNIIGSKLHVIKHAGHLSNLENSEDFNKHVKIFLSSVYYRRRKITPEAITSFVNQLRDKFKLLIIIFSI